MPPLFHIDPHQGVPAYRQLMDQIKLQVATGVLRAGEELPSTRAMSVELRLNPMTVSKAYSLLEREGLLERRRGQTLTVRASDAADSTARLAPLQEKLSAAAALTWQLDISPEQALQLFAEQLRQRPAPGPTLPSPPPSSPASS